MKENKRKNVIYILMQEDNTYVHRQWHTQHRLYEEHRVSKQSTFGLFLYADESEARNCVENCWASWNQ